jgi:uncharacterized protein involved in exopolysaccharide biosynthesis
VDPAARLADTSVLRSPVKVNRRLLVFGIVFTAVFIAGVVYTFSIPATYLARTTLQVDAGATPEQTADRAAFVGNEAQALVSSEMLERVLAGLRERSSISAHFESTAGLQEALSATPVPGTNTIQLEARGREPRQLAALVDLWAATYVQSRSVRQAVDRTADIDEARKAADSMEDRVSRKREELDAFRRQHGILSQERDENEIAAQMKSLTTAVNEARNKAVEAESRLGAIQESLANGAPVYRPQDKAVIVQLEQRSSDLRQKLKALELRYTPTYLALEPSVKEMHAELRQLEQQIERAKRSSQKALVDEATQDVVLAQKNVTRLEGQFGDRRNDALKFTSRFAEHKARVDELARLEAQLGKTKDRLAQLERSERTREPKYEVLGPAAASDRPVHPDYPRFVGYSLGGALLAAVLGIALVELLSPRPRVPAPHPQPIIQIAYPMLPESRREQLAGSTYPSLPPEERLRPALLSHGSRELTVAEVNALWSAATAEGRLVMGAVFTGLTLEELANLDWTDVHIEGAYVMTGHPARRHPVTSPFLEQVQAGASGEKSAGPIMITPTGSRLSVVDLEGLIAAAAHDAGLAEADTVDADTLRHTYISFLVREGLRLSELDRFVGPVAPALFLRYRNLSPSTRAFSASAVNPVFPAFRSA